MTEYVIRIADIPILAGSFTPNVASGNYDFKLPATTEIIMYFGEKGGNNEIKLEKGEQSPDIANQILAALHLPKIVIGGNIKNKNKNKSRRKKN